MEERFNVPVATSNTPISRGSYLVVRDFRYGCLFSPMVRNSNREARQGTTHRSKYGSYGRMEKYGALCSQHLRTEKLIVAMDQLFISTDCRHVKSDRADYHYRRAEGWCF